MGFGIANASDNVDLLAERRHVVGGGKTATGKQFAILIACRDHVLLRSLVHRQDVLVLVDDGIADDEDTVIGNALDQVAELLEAAVLAERVEMLADMRLEHVEVAVDQLARTERHLVGEMDAPAIGLDRIAFKRNLAGDVALRVLVVLALDVDRGSDTLDGTYRISGVVDGNPINIFKRGQHLGAQLGVKHRASGTFVDETVGGDGDDQHVAELASGLEMTHVTKMQEIKRPVRLDYGLAGAPALLAGRRDLGQGPDLFARALRTAGRRLVAQFYDA